MIPLTDSENHFADQDEPEAVWFWEHGIRVFPTDNKAPAVPKGTSQFAYRCTREQAARFREYGVPLGLFGVVDSDTSAAEAWNAAHLLHTPFKVTTGPYHDKSPGRGLHRYYRLVGDAPHFIHRDGHTIEFKHRGQYVVGPGSTRPDGVTYTAGIWSWNLDDIPYFPVADFLWDDGSCGAVSAAGDAFVLPDAISISERHDVLYRLMRSLAAHGVPFDGAFKVCLWVNRDRCKPPITNLDELKSYLQRAFQRKDRADFVRIPKEGWVLAGALVELGLPFEPVLMAIRAITPDFDPETSA